MQLDAMPMFHWQKSDVRQIVGWVRSLEEKFNSNARNHNRALNGSNMGYGGEGGEDMGEESQTQEILDLDLGTGEEDDEVEWEEEYGMEEEEGAAAGQ